LLYIPWHFPLHKESSITGASKKAEREFEKQFPAIYNHLLKYKKKLEQRNRAETGIRYEWYALQRWGANYTDDFSKQKIVFSRISGKEPCFAIDNHDVLTNDTGYIIVGEKLDYLLAMLTSNLIWFALKRFYMGGGIETEFKVNNLDNLSILLPCSNIEKKFESLIKSQKYKKINEEIYKLYGLSEEEINCLSFQLS